jgi:hypothetical protein
LIFSTQWYFCNATSSNPPISPMPSNAVFSWPRPSRVVSGAHVLVVVEDHQAVQT